MNAIHRSILAALALLLGGGAAAVAQQIAVETDRDLVGSFDRSEIQNCFPRSEDAQARLEGLLEGEEPVTVREFLGPIERVSIRALSPQLSEPQAIDLVRRWLDSTLIDPARDRFRGSPAMEDIFAPTTISVRLEGLVFYDLCEPGALTVGTRTVPGLVFCKPGCSPGRFVLFGNPASVEHLGPSIARDVSGVFWWHVPRPPAPEDE